jgi:hypothetical protein
MKGRSGAWGGGDDVGLDFRERKGMAMGCEEKRATASSGCVWTRPVLSALGRCED